MYITFLLFYVKDFIFFSISVKFISWQIFYEIVENQNLFGKIYENCIQIVLIFFNVKDFILYRYICKMYRLQNERHLKKKCDRLTDRPKDKVIHRRAPLLKTDMSWGTAPPPPPYKNLLRKK